jgi:hypothetical protein
VGGATAMPAMHHHVTARQCNARTRDHRHQLLALGLLRGGRRWLWLCRLLLHLPTVCWAGRERFFLRRELARHGWSAATHLAHVREEAKVAHCRPHRGAVAYPRPLRPQYSVTRTDVAYPRKSQSKTTGLQQGATDAAPPSPPPPPPPPPSSRYTARTWS